MKRVLIGLAVAGAASVASAATNLATSAETALGVLSGGIDSTMIWGAAGVGFVCTAVLATVGLLRRGAAKGGAR